MQNLVKKHNHNIRSSKEIRAVIIGASGYTGAELIRILLNHPAIKIVALVANQNANSQIEEIYQHLSYYNLPTIVTIDKVDFTHVDVVFGCLPHTTSQEIFYRLAFNSQGNPINSHLKFIDLSADFRLDNPEDYKLWYQKDHLAPALQKEATYGLSELNRKNIAKSRLVACPGCYPTAILLPLIPLMQNNIIASDNIIIDAKSGITGAGRSLKQHLLFTEVNENAKHYSVNNHRHLSEIEQELTLANGKIPVKVQFTPQLIPLNRGILATIYCNLEEGRKYLDAVHCLETKYQDEYFVKIIDGEPSLTSVAGSNFIMIAVKESRLDGKIIILSAIDNLCKGSSGQAVQNLNIIYGLDERMGLEFPPIFP